MRSGTIAVLLGCLLLLRFPLLPGLPWEALLLLALPLLLMRNPVRLFAGLMVGFLWAGIHAQALLDTRPPADWQGRELRVLGTVQGIPVQRPGYLRVDFAPRWAWLPDGKHDTGGLWRLTGYRIPWTPKSGEVVELIVKLRQPRRHRSPGSFDFQSYLFFHRIVGTGRIIALQRPSIDGTPSARVFDRFRQDLAERIQQYLGPLQGGIVTALALGDRQRVRGDDTRTFRLTGTAHLLAISGLHISMVAGLAFLLAQGGWRLSARACELLPATRVAAIASMVAALSYAALAGFSLPTQRASIMLLTGALALLVGRDPSPSRVIAMALAAVLVMDPLAPASTGFWLSFVAVAVILYFVSVRLWQPPALVTWVRIQALLVTALLPLTLSMFGYFSLVAIPANLVAIPWVGTTVVPATLLGVLAEGLWPGAGYWPWWLADRCMSGLMHFLRWLQSLELLLWSPGYSLWTSLSLALGVSVLLLPRGLPGRWLGLVFLLPLVPLNPSGGSLWVALLDTGQGFSAVVHKDSRAVVYDTGPRYGVNFDAGNAVLVPYLRWRGMTTIDMLVVSRGIAARTGGIKSLRAEITPVSVEGPNDESMPLQGKQPCGSRSVEWQGGYVVKAVRSLDLPNRCVLEVWRHDRLLVLLDPDYATPPGPTSEAGWPILVTSHAAPVIDSGMTLGEDDAGPVALVGGSLLAEGSSRDGVVSTAEHGTIEFEIGPDRPISASLHFPSSWRFWHQ